VSRTRCLVLLLTILALVYMAANQPKPVRAVEVKYCSDVIYWKWAEAEWGRKVKLWYLGWGPCSEMDRYEEA
jgi:hypothetical protein